MGFGILIFAWVLNRQVRSGILVLVWLVGLMAQWICWLRNDRRLLLSTPTYLWTSQRSKHRGVQGQSLASNDGDISFVEFHGDSHYPSSDGVDGTDQSPEKR